MDKLMNKETLQMAERVFWDEHQSHMGLTMSQSINQSLEAAIACYIEQQHKESQDGR